VSTRARLLLPLLLAAACGPAGDPPAPSTDTPPQRIAVIGPSTAENLFHLGAGHLVVGVSDYCLEPAAADLPRLGGQADPNLERLAVLEPDLVLTQGANPRLEEWCRLSGVRYRAFTTDSVAEWEDEVGELGALLGREADAGALVDGVRSALAAAGQPALEESPTVLLVISRRVGSASGLTVAGASSFLSELLAAAGGSNLLADNPRDYFDLGEELLLTRQPDFVFELLPSDPDPAATWKRDYPSLRAAQEGRVVAFPQEHVLLPGPRMAAVAQSFAAALRR
jgi:iron complex transport system substrate-binding protein